MEYYSANKFIKDRFGQKLYKISIDGGFTCPNRDGTIDTRACIFCSTYGSGDYAQDRRLSITDQIEEGKKLVLKKSNKDDPKFIAYFQAFTNTYGPVDLLEEIYMEAINHHDIVALSIGTRPDCLDEDVIALLESLNKIKPIWVELGLQSIHKTTSDYIRRGYELEVYDKACEDLSRIGIEQIITHVIIGLPYESKDMILETVDYVINSKANGIKLQLLHVLKNTDLAKEYKAGRFSILTMEEYTDIVVDAIKLVPNDMVIHRVTGDGNREELIAPLWSLDKWKVLNTINAKLK